MSTPWWKTALNVGTGGLYGLAETGNVRNLLPGLISGGAIGGPIIGQKPSGSKLDAQQTQQQALIAQGNLGNQLSADEAQYMQIPQTLNTDYTANSHNAGTYADTPQFQNALQASVGAGAQGAAIDNLTRQQAIRQALDMQPLPSSIASTSGLGPQVTQALKTGGGLSNPDPTGPYQPTPGAVPNTPGTINAPQAPVSSSAPGQALPASGAPGSVGVNGVPQGNSDPAALAAQNIMTGSSQQNPKSAVNNGLNNQQRQAAIQKRAV